MLLDIVFKNLQREGLLLDRRHTHLLLAYSGGIDSTVLLHLMAQLRERENLSLTAAYYNHGWRHDPEEFGVLHANCADLRVPLVLIQADRTVPHTEAAAREARYTELSRLAVDLNAQGILTAHQADDQIETLLFHLFRGTGLEGLVGIQKNLTLTAPQGASVSVLRPMLDIYRDGLVRYAESNQLSYFNDPTNANTRLHRNAIRQELLPFVQERFPQVKNALLRLTDLSQGDLAIIQEAMAPVWQQVYQPPTEPNTPGTLNAIVFNQLALPYQRRIIKQYLTENGIQVDFQTIEETIEFIRGETRRNLSAGLKSLPCEVTSTPAAQNRFLSLYKNTISILTLPKTPPMAHSPQSAIGVPVNTEGETVLEPLKAHLHVTELDEPTRKLPGLMRPEESLEVYVNLSGFQGKPLVLRTRRPGDKIRPFGMPVPMRLKSYLINRGVPRFERDTLPLLACGNEILWVAGVGISEHLRVLGKPSHLLKLDLSPTKPHPQGEGSVPCPS